MAQVSASGIKRFLCRYPCSSLLLLSLLARQVNSAIDLPALETYHVDTHEIDANLPSIETKRFLQTSMCRISTSIQCTVDETGEDCENLKESMEDCRDNIQVTIMFEYCNKASRNQGWLFDLKPIALIDNMPVSWDDRTNLPPDDCETMVVSTPISTCVDVFSANLEVEGLGNDSSIYCFGANTYKHKIQRPLSTECQLSSHVKCTIAGTNQECGNLAIPYRECGDVDMTFEFKYCNNENSGPIDLLTDGSIALINSVPMDSVEINKLRAEQCRMTRITAPIDTCRRSVSASLRVIGSRTHAIDETCRGYDYYRTKFKRSTDKKNHVSASIQCVVNDTDQNCENMIVSRNECRNVDFTFNFIACNNGPDNTLEFRTDTTLAFVNDEPVKGISRSDLGPGKCRRKTITKSIDTCNDWIESSFRVEGDYGGNIGDYVYDEDIYRIKIKRPTTADCRVATKVTCTIDSNGERCQDILVDEENCKKVGMTFEFEYCNSEENLPLDFRNENGIVALVNTSPVKGLDDTTLSSGRCRKVKEKRSIDTCKGSFSASLMVDGWRGKNAGDKCYSYQFYHAKVKRKPFPQCSISSHVRCLVSDTNEECEDLVVPYDDCRNIDMTFLFKYCNNEQAKTVTFDQNKSITLINTDPASDFDLSDLEPRQCRTERIERSINTCKGSMAASLKIEGTRGAYAEDICYAYDFYKTKFKRPRTSDCQVSSEVTCTVGNSKTKCEDYVVPRGACKEEPMIFAFRYCNNEPEHVVDVRESKTVALINTEPVIDLNISDLDPGQCHTKKVTKMINTCRSSFAASLKIEGWRKDGSGDYCYGYDFYKNRIKRPQKDDCQVSSDVKCTVKGTNGQSCDNLVIPYEDCGQTDMIFHYKYCNNEPKDVVELRDDDRAVIPLINTVRQKWFKKPYLNPGECRQKRVTKSIDTCKGSFAASLAINGRRGSDIICHGWDFFKTRIKRPKDQGCQVSAHVGCVIKGTGEECEDIVVPYEECGPTDMVFEFKYCNNEPNDVLDFRDGERGAIALINTVQQNGIVTKDLPPGRCRTKKFTKSIDTCKGSFAASLEINGNRGENGVCYGWDFFKTRIKRPKPSPSPTPTPQLTTDPTYTTTPEPTVADTFELTESPTVSPTVSLTVSPTATITGLPTVTREPCFRTPEQRESEIFELISTVSSPVDFDDPESPQSRARKWLLYEDEYDVFCAVPCSEDYPNSGGVIQRFSLAVFYFSTNGDDSWIDCGRNSEYCRREIHQFPSTIAYFSGQETWLDPIDECLWGGLGCANNTQCLDTIDFEENSIGGTIPSELGKLNKLRYIMLEGAENRTNYLSNQFETLSGTIPTELGSMSQLVFLDLNFNKLSGTIPTELFSLPNIAHFDINDNELTGSIPNEIGNIVQARFFAADYNLLSGTLPTTIGTLIDLKTLYIDNNKFTGPIPSEIGLLNDLKFLTIYQNQLTGTIPTEMGQLNQLQTFIISDNNLSGSIPTELGIMSAMEDLWLSNNNEITGTIPVELGQLTNLYTLYMQDTSLVGTMPLQVCLLRDTLSSSFGFAQMHNLTVDCEEVECCCCTNCISDTCANAGFDIN